MTDITTNSFAAVSAIRANNVAHTVSAGVLPRKILLIGTYDETITTVQEDTPVQVFSAAEVGGTTGYGFPLHRLAVQAFSGGNGVETWYIAQAEDGAAVQASGTITIVGTATSSGTIALYIDGISVPVAVASADDATAMATAMAAAINADRTLPVTATSALGVVTVTAKAGGTYGNDISITFDWAVGDVANTPTGITSITVVDMASGATDPDLDDALNATGTGDLANENYFTDVVVGYGKEVTANLDKFANYTGQGNTTNGLWSPTVNRPWRAFWGNTVAGSTGLTNLIALTDARKLDRSQGIIPMPGSPNNPYEIAAYTAGYAARINNNLAEENTLGMKFTGFIPGDKSDMWTSEYSNRNTAVKSGLSTTKLESGVMTLQNLLTFYRPDNVAIENNGYRSMRNISVLENITNSQRVIFASPAWQGVTIVNDIAKVTNLVSRAKARDTGSVRDTMFKLIDEWAANAWIADPDFSKENLSVAIRVAGNGFDIVTPVVLSGEAGIFNGELKFDTSFAAIL